MADLFKRQLTPNKLLKTLDICYMSGVSVFVWGAPGIGKSQIFRQYAKQKLNDNFIDIRLSYREPTDLRGIPLHIQENGEHKVLWVIGEFPTDPNWVGLILFDELNAATPNVQAATFQIVLDRKIGDYVFPKGAFICAAGNRDTDRGTTYKMAKPLQNRFIHFELKVSVNDWIDWATDNFFAPEIISYVSAYPSSLLKYDPSDPCPAFVTPRSMEFLNNIFPNIPFKDDPIISYCLVAGSIGDVEACQFLEHVSMTSKLPPMEDIFSGKIKKLNIEKDVGQKYAIVVNLCRSMQEYHSSLDKKTIRQYDANSLNFMMNSFGENIEFITLFYKMAMMKYSLNIPMDFSDSEVPDFSTKIIERLAAIL